MRAALRRMPGAPDRRRAQRRASPTASLTAARGGAAHPGNYAAQLAYGQALAAAGDRAAFEPLEKAAALVPVATGEERPHAMMARLAEQLGDTARAIAEYQGGPGAGPHRGRGGAAACRARARSAVATPEILMQAYERIVAIDPFDPAGAQRPRPARGRTNNQPRRPSANSRRRWRSVPPTAPARTATSRKRTCWPAGRRKQRPRRSPRSKSHRASIVRRSCCFAPSRGPAPAGAPAMNRLLPVAAAAGLLLWVGARWLTAATRRCAEPTRRMRDTPACSGRSRGSATPPGRVPPGGF